MQRSQLWGGEVSARILLRHALSSYSTGQCPVQPDSTGFKLNIEPSQANEKCTTRWCLNITPGSVRFWCLKGTQTVWQIHVECDECGQWNIVICSACCVILTSRIDRQLSLKWLSEKKQFAFERAKYRRNSDVNLWKKITEQCGTVFHRTPNTHRFLTSPNRYRRGTWREGHFRNMGAADRLLLRRKLEYSCAHTDKNWIFMYSHRQSNPPIVCFH